MSKSKKLYPYTSPQYSAERMGLYKLDRVIDLLTILLQKFDDSRSLGDEDYSELLIEIKAIQADIRTYENRVK